jgi:hypothetical protein
MTSRHTLHYTFLANKKLYQSKVISQDRDIHSPYDMCMLPWNPDVITDDEKGGGENLYGNYLNMSRIL